jgi:hypothetical protein
MLPIEPSSENVDRFAAMIADAAELKDRRRAGRMATVEPVLIPLLRGEVVKDLPPPKFLEDDAREGDPIMGIAVAVAASAVLWGLMGGIGWLLFQWH